MNYKGKKNTYISITLDISYCNLFQDIKLFQRRGNVCGRFLQFNKINFLQFLLY